MKKLKLLPSILMLVACVAVLGVGVFAVAPTQNKISGSITINASNNPITIKVYENDASGTLLATAEARAGATIELDSLNFTTTNANKITEVEPIKLAIVFSTTSNENLVIDTETIESLDGTNSTGTIEDIVSVTKLHSYTATDTSTGLACFTSGKDYTITCTFRLADFVNETTTVDFNMAFDVYKASEYEGDGINGVDYLYFGSFPQSEATSTTGLTDTGRTFGAYDDTTGGETTRPIYTDGTDDYVKLDTKYYKIEPLKWNILKTTDGTAMLMCDNIVEQVSYRKNYEYLEFNSISEFYATDTSGNILTDEDNNPIYANNYEYSDLRAYLNNAFYNGAFNNLQKQLIPLTEVDNSVESTGYDSNRFACNNTNDYVFALSWEEVVNSTYGFEANELAADINRMVKTTAYSRATGIYSVGEYTVERFLEEHNDDNCGCGNYTVQDIVDNCWCYGYPSGVSEETFMQHYSFSSWWWLRSAVEDSDSCYARNVGAGGNAYNNQSSEYNVNNGAGCVPALRLSLEG